MLHTCNVICVFIFPINVLMNEPTELSQKLDERARGRSCRRKAAVSENETASPMIASTAQ